MKNFKLGLFGKRYLDKTFYLSDFKISETNKSNKTIDSLGGIYNIKKHDRAFSKVLYEDGFKKAYIISDQKTSTRTAITDRFEDYEAPVIDYGSIDWLHIAYIDDLANTTSIKFGTCPISIDFCTCDDRSKYLKIIEKCTLVFDSRERKELYNGIITDALIILHDSFGSECIFKGNKIFENSIEPLANLSVNGAGDIFAAHFIQAFLKNGLKEAVDTASIKTTRVLNEI